MLTIASRLDVMNRLGRPLPDPTRSRIILTLLDRPAFGPYLQRIGANKPYEPFALSVIAFGITWACMGLIQLVTRFSKHTKAAR